MRVGCYAHSALAHWLGVALPRWRGVIPRTRARSSIVFAISNNIARLQPPPGIRRGCLVQQLVTTANAAYCSRTCAFQMAGMCTWRVSACSLRAWGRLAGYRAPVALVAQCSERRFCAVASGGRSFSHTSEKRRRRARQLRSTLTGPLSTRRRSATLALARKRLCTEPYRRPLSH